MQRITISLPEYLYEDLLQMVPTGSISSFVARAVETNLTGLEKDPIEEFIEVRKKLPKKGKEEIMKEIKRGRQ